MVSSLDTVFIHVVVCVYILILFIIVYIPHYGYTVIYIFNSWTFGFLQFIDNTNNAPMHILVFVFWWHKHTVLHGKHLGVESPSLCIFLFNRNCHTLFQHTCAGLPCPQKCLRVQRAPWPLHHSLLLDFIFLPIWWVAVVSHCGLLTRLSTFSNV